MAAIAAATAATTMAAAKTAAIMTKRDDYDSNMGNGDRHCCHLFSGRTDDGDGDDDDDNEENIRSAKRAANVRGRRRESGRAREKENSSRALLLNDLTRRAYIG